MSLPAPVREMIPYLPPRNHAKFCMDPDALQPDQKYVRFLVQRALAITTEALVSSDQMVVPVKTTARFQRLAVDLILENPTVNPVALATIAFVHVAHANASMERCTLKAQKCARMNIHGQAVVVATLLQGPDSKTSAGRRATGALIDCLLEVYRSRDKSKLNFDVFSKDGVAVRALFRAYAAQFKDSPEADDIIAAFAQAPAPGVVCHRAIVGMSGAPADYDAAATRKTYEGYISALRANYAKLSTPAVAAAVEAGPKRMKW